MCGITGFICSKPNSQVELHKHLFSMVNQLHHRGPDHQEHWISDKGNCGLGHARLAILDLSPAGVQPMSSTSGRYTIVFNGEIYNFIEIKSKLAAKGIAFKGTSDTEVLLAAIEEYGVKNTLPILNGMFAFGLWDNSEETLTLARDRAGEKPLYFGKQNDNFIFASDLNVLKCTPGVNLKINKEAMALYFSHNYIPAPHSIFNDFFKLEPGYVLTLSAKDETLSWNTNCYWQTSKGFEKKDNELNDKQIVDQLESLLTDSVNKQMVSDVPLGALLSGGIDSSTIVSVMQSLSDKPINTFTIGFEEKAYDESKFASQIASHLGTDHHELQLSPVDVQDVIAQMPTIYSEPFADSSQLPTYLVCQMAKQHVTVALSGDAGDELFSGYDRYYTTLKSAKNKNFRSSNNESTNSASIARKLKQLDRTLDPLITRIRRYPTVLSSVKFYRYWQNNYGDISFVDFYRSSLEYWPYGFINRSPIRPIKYALNQNEQCQDRMAMMQWLDFNSYLPDDILCKVDRAAMANSLETRVPLLDHRIIEFAASIPTSMLHNNQQSKWPLREILYKHVPKSLIERPKMGFAIPIGSWLKGDLRGWAETLLSTEALDSHQLLETAYIQHVWKQHKETEADLSFYLWGILMFQQWYQDWKPYINA